MTKVTVNPRRAAPGVAASSAEPMPAHTPTQAVLREAAQEFVVTDAEGRQLTLKKPDVLAQFDLIEALGELAKNDVYRLMCLPAIYVIAIDGIPVPAPNNKVQVRALISRLGETGFEAVRRGIAEHYPQPDEAGEDEAIKKS